MTTSTDPWTVRTNPARPAATDVVTDDRLWHAYARGLADGIRLGYDDGYQAGAADEAAAEVAEWTRLREQLDQAARDVGIRQRRTTYRTPACTPEQIRALTDWSWRPGQPQDTFVQSRIAQLQGRTA